MKQKLTTLLFGLLLAVGWTSSAFAQSATYKAADMSDWTYQWGNASGVTQTSHYVISSVENGETVYRAEEVHDPYQIYGLLKNVYMDKRFPGPFYSAYAPNKTTRQDPVYYGGIEGGWNIPGGTVSAVGDVTMTFASYSIVFSSITVTGNKLSTPLTWTYADNGTNLPTGWGKTGNLTDEGSPYNGCSIGGQGTSGTITIPASLLNGSTQVTVTMECRRYSNSSTTTNCNITVNGTTKNVTSTTYGTYTWTVNGTSQNDVNYYKPDADNEGYTAIMVALYNDTTKIYPENMDYYDGSWEFTDSTSLINYIRDNIDFVKLLTDGLRVSEGTDEAGTVFNCDGNYNRFFILGKGQARKKADQLLANINNGYWPSYCGEEGPFKQMFEEFSPTSGALGSDVTNFYSKLMEGSTFPVVHDCASVIQNKHQFSMSGKKGTTYRALSGLNFYIPDYRLLWWKNTRTISSGWSSQTYTVDGRDMVPYIETNTNTGEHTGYQFYTGTNIYHFAAWYAQYNQTHAPLMGIYKITLDAEAEMKADTTHQSGNRNFTVTLTWVSSLNEMSGHEVKQTYTVYYYDADGKLQYVVAEGITDGKTGLTTISYDVEQQAHSYSIDYIVYGSPDDTDHPEFVAISNVDGVIIPGWDDFLALTLDHHESDFVVKNDGKDKANWYRNFLLVDNDIFNGLTVENVSNGINSFNIYRYNNKDASEKKVAILAFDDPTAERVHYTVTYDDEGNNAQLEDQKVVETPKYLRSTMSVPDQGYVRVVGNGDIIIQPNGFAVNFKSITVKSNGNTIGNNTWNSNQSNLPSNWGVSPGSLWEPHTVPGTSDKVYYLEGGGYIYIPNILNTYNNVTVEINAYGDGSSIANIAVNDHKQAIGNNAGTTYTWNVSGSRGGDRATNDISFIAGNNSSYGKTITLDGITITNNHTYTNNGFDYSPYRLYDGPLTITTDRGSIKKIVFNGSDTSRPVSRISGEGYSYDSNNVGTWTGDASSVEFTLSGQVRCSSIIVTLETPDGPDRTGMLRLGHLHIVDQLKEAIPDDNTHPDTYYYVLRYQPAQGDAKQSGIVPVNIQKTEVKANGFYTKEEVDADTFEPLMKLDIVKADVTMDLSKVNPDILNYQMQGKHNSDPGENTDWLTQLQMMSSGKYKEMMEFLSDGTENPSFEATYNPTIHHYFDNSTPLLQGTYGVDYFTYAPSVSTWGLKRRYYETDGLDNTYGGPLWKTGVGKVEVSQALAQKQMKKVVVDGAEQWIPNPSTSWTEGDVEGAQAYTLYFLSTSAQGFLPSAAVSNIPYEPYMFRVFVESASGKLRKFEPVYGTNSQGQEIQIGLKDGGPITGKYCVGSYDINSGTWTWDGESESIMFSKSISNDAPAGENPGWSGNMMYGAATDITDLKVYVRFYYMRQGWNSREGDGPARPANGSESRGQDPGSDTGIFDIFGTATGEVVSTTYYNAQGIQSDKPFDGLNIVVTRYSNGTTSTTKVIR